MAGDVTACIARLPVDLTVLEPQHATAAAGLCITYGKAETPPGTAGFPVCFCNQAVHLMRSGGSAPVNGLALPGLATDLHEVGHATAGGCPLVTSRRAE